MWDRLELNGDVLRRKFFDVSTGRFWRQVIIPRSMRDEFITTVHSVVVVSHCGRTRTEQAIRQRAYWVGWTSDVHRVLQGCERCVRYKRGKLPPPHPPSAHCVRRAVGACLYRHYRPTSYLPRRFLVDPDYTRPL